MAGKKNSRYMKFAELMEKLSKEWANVKPEDLEKKIQEVAQRNVGQVTKVFTDLALNATADDLALMSTSVKTLAAAAKYRLYDLQNKHRQYSDPLIRKVVEAENSLQRYYKLKAGQLKGGKKGNAELIELIEANMSSKKGLCKL